MFYKGYHVYSQYQFKKNLVSVILRSLIQSVINKMARKGLFYIETIIQNILSSLVQFSHSVVSDSLRPHESQYIRPPCPSSAPGVCPNSCSSNQCCHPAISSSVVPFYCPQSFPASGTFPISQLFASDEQNTGQFNISHSIT